MGIKTTIHSINKQDGTAVISLVDEGHVWIDAKNIEMKLNPDGTANTAWFNQYIKLLICEFRLRYIDKTEEDLL